MTSKNLVFTLLIIRDPQHMRMLIDLKNIIARQLPKMPKEYIVKLIFDRKHEAMVIVKNDTKIIGGICFRPFDSQKFAEIAFLAVTATEQVKGYGTRLMNKYKEEMQRRGIEYLLTYADNYAIGKNILLLHPQIFRVFQKARLLQNYQNA